MSRSVAEILAVPIDVVFSLLRGPEEAPQASALLLTASRGALLHDLLAVQAAQQECDVSVLHKVCTSLVSSKTPSLTELAPPAMQAAAAATRAADALQSRVTDCLAALAGLSAQLNQHAQVSTAVASQLRRQPGCRELAIERDLVAGIQREAAQRAAHVARLRGHCALPPFAHALEALKAEAAAQLHIAAAEAPSPVPADRQLQAAAPANPPPATDLHEKVDVLARSLGIVVSKMDHLIGTLMPAATGAAGVVAATGVAGPSQMQQIEGGGSGGRSLDSQQQQQQHEAAAAAASQPPLIQVLSPGGTTVIDPDPRQDVAHASQRGGGAGSGGAAPGRRALRGDAAPSTTAEGDADGNGGSLPHPSAADGGDREEENPTMPSLHLPLSDELPSAVIPGTAGLCGEGTEDPEGPEELEEEKENVDATQSQGAGGSAEAAAAVTQPTEDNTTQEKGGSADKEEDGSEPQRVAGMEPERPHAAEGDGALPPPMWPRPTGRQAALPSMAAAAARLPRSAIPPSQKDSTSPGGGRGGAAPPGGSLPLTGGTTTTTTKSGGSGHGSGNGSGNGVAVPKGAETPAGPSKVLMPPPGPTSQPLGTSFSPSVLAQRPPSTLRSDYGKRRAMDTPSLPPSSTVGPKRARLRAPGRVPGSQEEGERMGSADDGAGPASQPLLSNDAPGALPSLGAWRQGPSQTPNLMSVLKRDLNAMSEVPESPELMAPAEATPLTAAATTAHHRQLSERARRAAHAGETPFAFAQKGATQMISMGATPQPTARPSLEVGQQVSQGEGVERKGVESEEEEEEESMKG